MPDPHRTGPEACTVSAKRRALACGRTDEGCVAPSFPFVAQERAGSAVHPLDRARAARGAATSPPTTRSLLSARVDGHPASATVLGLRAERRADEGFARVPQLAGTTVHLPGR